MLEGTPTGPSLVSRARLHFQGELRLDTMTRFSLRSAGMREEPIRLQLFVDCVLGT